MDIRRLAPELAVAAQLRVDDLAEVAATGFRTVINNRPDGEEPGQPAAIEIERAAYAAGLGYHHIPVAPGKLDDRDARRFGAAVRNEGPVLAFCRTGNRSAKLWARALELEP